MEVPVVFGPRTGKMVGIWHWPSRGRSRMPCVVFLHGFTGHKAEAQRLFVKTARTLAAAGIAAFRFDFRGCGDSSGEFSDVTITGEIADARTALAYVRKHPRVDGARLGVLGFSMGGLVGATILGEYKDLRAAVLWAPVADLKALVEARLTAEAAEQLRELGCVDYGGFAIGKSFFEEALSGKHRPLESIQNTNAAVLLLHGSQDETVPVSASDAFETALKQSHKKVAKIVLPGANHTFSSLAWETQLIGLTLRWFCDHLNIRSRSSG